MWADPRFKNFKKVGFMLAGRRVCFNVLKTISGHMESASLGDLWTEAGVYAASTAETLLDSKTYYGALRGHNCSMNLCGTSNGLS